MNKLDKIDKQIINSIIENNKECVFLNKDSINNIKKFDILNKKYLNGLEMNLLQASIAFKYVVKTNNQNITENAMKGIK